MSHPSANDIVAALSALAATQNLRARAFDDCRKSLATSAEEGSGYLDGWAVDEIEPHFRSCSLVFDNLLGYPYLDTRFDLCVRDNSGVCYRDLWPIGHYRLITRPDGTEVDDYLVIDRPKQADE